MLPVELDTQDEMMELVDNVEDGLNSPDIAACYGRVGSSPTLASIEHTPFVRH